MEKVDVGLVLYLSWRIQVESMTMLGREALSQSFILGSPSLLMAMEVMGSLVLLEGLLPLQLDLPGL